jgi:hypothetical protein
MSYHNSISPVTLSLDINYTSCSYGKLFRINWYIRGTQKKEL